MKKLPWQKWFWGDWKADQRLRLVTPGARGLWVEMLGIMVAEDPYGYLQVGPRIISEDNLVGLVGMCTLAEVEGWMAELEGMEIYSRDESGVIYSRRLLRDEEIRQKRAAGGKKGGNPVLTKKTSKVSLKDNPRDQRLEARDQKLEEVCAEAPQTATSAPQVLLWIPAKKGKRPAPDGYPVRENGTGYEIGISEAVVAEYARDFEISRREILELFKGARRWVKARPRKKKTIGNITVFLTNWVENRGKFQRRPPPRGGNEPPQYRPLN